MARLELLITEGLPGTVMSNGAQTDYQVAVTVDTASLVTAGKVRSDGADIRLTNSVGTQLPYWIESGMNTNSTKIWVKVDSIPDGNLASPDNQTTIYLNYGDPDLTVGASDIKSTMLFYDDFSSPEPVIGAPGAEAGSLPSAVYIWNNTLNTGSGGWATTSFQMTPCWTVVSQP